MYLFPVLIFLSQGLLHVSKASNCSELNLTPLNTINDENYLIQSEQLNSSNIFKVTFTMKQSVSDTSWFIMGASNTLQLIGSWEPFTSADGQVIDCSVATEQAVTNQNSNLDNFSRLQFSFYWTPPPLYNNMVIFVATIFGSNTENGNSSPKYIQSTPVQIQQLERTTNISRC